MFKVPTAFIRKHSLPFSLVFLFVIWGLGFSNNLNGNWISDDHHQVETNPYIRTLNSFPHFFSHNVISSTAENGNVDDYYRPLVFVSYALDHSLFGDHPWGFHLSNNLLHFFTAFFLFLFLRFWLSVGISLGASTLFLIHPIVVESVSWVGSRADLLIGLWGMAFFWVYIHLFSKKHPRIHWYFLFFLLIPLGCFSKEFFFLLPLTPLFVWFISKNGRNLAIGSVAILGLSLGIRFLIVDSQSIFPPLVTFGNNFILFSNRFWEVLFLPQTSSPIFPYRNPTFWDVFVFFLICGCLGSWMLFIRRRLRPQEWVAHLCALIFFLATALPIGLRLHAIGVVWERYFYLPFLGAIIFLALTAPHLSRFFRAIPYQKKIVASLFLILIGGLIFLTREHNRAWKNEETLWSRAIQMQPASPLPHWFMAMHFRRMEDRTLEMRHYQQAIEKDPYFFLAGRNLVIRHLENEDLPKAHHVLLKLCEETQNEGICKNAAELEAQMGKR